MTQNARGRLGWACGKSDAASSRVGIGHMAEWQEDRRMSGRNSVRDGGRQFGDVGKMSVRVRSVVTCVT